MLRKTIRVDEIPKGKKKFFVLRQDSSMHLILEEYSLNEFDNWENKIIKEFSSSYIFDKNRAKLFEEIKDVIPQEKTLYVEEGTFIDED